MLRFTGERSDIPQLMAASDVIVQCSTYDDPFPGVVLEAMAMGKVVVATKAGGVPKQIRHGEDGLLFRMGDAAELAQHVNEVLADPALKQKLGHAAVKNLACRFNFEKFMNEFRRLYETLAAGDSQQHRRSAPAGLGRLDLAAVTVERIANQ
ncbi:glycosyltransferase family 4 protein [candidate division KSB1 bacterium]|nr:glycosyltransferase family 4 protein [candidate division KSB1 bacterium]